jgi:CxxC motif-containing protein (DUF1111 family)
MQPFDPAPIAGLTPEQLKFFCSGLAEFRKVEAVKDGLGPTMNLDSCVGCHAFPAAGGTSPPKSIGNSQIAFLRKFAPGTNVAPSFITQDGPVREVRFIRDSAGQPDGGVHSLFTITGLPDAGGCTLKQPDFAAQFKGINKPGNNAIFRIPTPLFGAGLMEQIEDSAIVANQEEKRTQNYGGIGRLPVGRLNFERNGHTRGEANRNGNDGTIARFGWKAQNKSLLLFSGEAYNVEMGITNLIFNTERDEATNCSPTAPPNSIFNLGGLVDQAVFDDITNFANFMRFLAPPTPAPSNNTIVQGSNQFFNVGCARCHTTTLQTGASPFPSLANQTIHPYSDFALHHMGPDLADNISQGLAGGDEFRTAPLWGLGQRIFFLHDGRTADLLQVIKDHSSAANSQYPASEANAVVGNFFQLSTSDQQAVLAFLRSL